MYIITADSLLVGSQSEPVLAHIQGLSACIITADSLLVITADSLLEGSQIRARARSYPGTVHITKGNMTRWYNKYKHFLIVALVDKVTKTTAKVLFLCPEWEELA